MRQYLSLRTLVTLRLFATLAPIFAVIALVGSTTCGVTLTTLGTPRLSDVDLSASTDGEDAGVVCAELSIFVEAEALFAADVMLTPVCALRALR